MLAFLAGTEDDREGNYIGQSGSLLHQRQNPESLLPLIALLTTTDGGIAGEQKSAASTPKDAKTAAIAGHSHKH